MVLDPLRWRRRGRCTSTHWGLEGVAVDGLAAASEEGCMKYSGCASSSRLFVPQQHPQQPLLLCVCSENAAICSHPFLRSVNTSSVSGNQFRQPSLSHTQSNAAKGAKKESPRPQPQTSRRHTHNVCRDVASPARILIFANSLSLTECAFGDDRCRIRISALSNLQDAVSGMFSFSRGEQTTKQALQG